MIRPVRTDLEANPPKLNAREEKLSFQVSDEKLKFEMRFYDADGEGRMIMSRSFRTRQKCVFNVMNLPLLKLLTTILIHTRLLVAVVR